MKTKFCECGCGQRVKLCNRYVCGHNRKGKCLSKLTKKKMSESRKGKPNKFKGKTYIDIHGIEGTKERIRKMVESSKGREYPPLSKEHKRKIGKAMKGQLVGDRNPAKRPEVRRKISRTLKGRTKEVYPKLSHSVASYKKAGGKISKTLKGKYTGEKSSNWKGGICNFPYPFDFNEELKELIRKRDNRTCQLCGKIRKDKEKNLSVHHIDYIKENLDPRNLITLCCGCNGKVNSSHENWIKFFRLKLKLIYHKKVRV